MQDPLVKRVLHVENIPTQIQLLVALAPWHIGFTSVSATLHPSPSHLPLVSRYSHQWLLLSHPWHHWHDATWRRPSNASRQSFVRQWPPKPTLCKPIDLNIAAVGLLVVQKRHTRWRSSNSTMIQFWYNCDTKILILWLWYDCEMCTDSLQSISSMFRNVWTFLPNQPLQGVCSFILLRLLLWKTLWV